MPEIVLEDQTQKMKIEEQPVQEQPVQEQPVQEQPVQEQPVQEQPTQKQVVMTVEEAQKKLDDMSKAHEDALQKYNKVAESTTDVAGKLEVLTLSTLDTNEEIGKLRRELLTVSQNRYESLAEVYTCLSSLMSFFVEVKNQEVKQLQEQVAAKTQSTE